MASWTTFLCLALTLLFYTQSSLGMITCEDLDENSCAFAVSSSGYRCVLEMKLKRSGYVELFCRTSDIEAEKVKDYVENDKCIKACGLDRNTVGISSDSLLDSRFTQKLCSPECYNTCSNIVDLYFNLAAGEGAFLPKLCEDQETNVRRGISEIRSSGIEAARPVSVSEKSVAWPPFAWAPFALVEEDLASEHAEPPC